MKTPTIEQELLAVIDELLGTTELNLDEIEHETRITIEKAWQVRDKAIRHGMQLKS